MVMRRDDDPERTRLRPLSPPSEGELWLRRIRLFAAAASSMIVAAALSCTVASLALERFANREIVLRGLATVAVGLIITCAAFSGLLAASLVQRLHH
jgi:hypothetical protein